MQRDNLLKKRSELINKCRHQNKFTLVRNDSKDQELYFHCDISRCIPIGASVLVSGDYVLHYVFQNRNRAAQMDGFIGKILQVIFPVKAEWKRRDLFVWILIHCNLFLYVISFDWRLPFKYQNLVFSFLPYVIILLFPPIYMVTEPSFMTATLMSSGKDKTRVYGCIYIYMYIYK